MSATPASSEPVQDALFRALPHLFEMPEDLTGDTSWERAQTEQDQGGILNHAERLVFLEGSDGPQRLVFCLTGSALRCKCPCESFTYRDWCAHVASCWWRWVRGKIDVYHVETGRVYRDPPPWLRLGQTANIDEEQLRELPPKRLEAWLHCEYGPEGVRDFARRSDRAPGTVGNHLRWAREAVGRAER